MSRWMLPAAFGAAGALFGVNTGEAVSNAVHHPDARAIVIVVYFLLRMAVALAFAAFTIGRGDPHRHARSPLALVSCAVAMLAVLAFAAPRAGSATALVFAGDLVAMLSCAWLLASVLSLGRCFGVLPEARGLVTSGVYRHVRHPVYLGELGACAGLALAAPTLLNAAVLGAFAAAQAIRMGLEERALTLAFPDYTAYAAHTPRLIPRLGIARSVPHTRAPIVTDALPPARSLS